MASAEPSIAVVYGFSEGWLTGRLLRHAFVARGLKNERVQNARIVLAHSGGFLTLRHPETIRTLVLVGPDTWHTSLLSSLRQKLRYEYRVARQKKHLGLWLRNGMRNWFYMPTFHTIRLVHGLTRPKLPPFGSRTLVIRNRYDPYCKAENVLSWPRHVVCISLDGGHDDLWTNPEPYAEIVKAVA